MTKKTGSDMNRSLAVLLLALFVAGCATNLWVGRPDSDVSLRGATVKDSVYVENNAIYMGMPGRFVRASLGPPEEVDYAYGENSDYPSSTQLWLYRLPMRCLQPNRCPDYAISKVYISDGKVTGIEDMPGKYTGL